MDFLYLFVITIKRIFPSLFPVLLFFKKNLLFLLLLMSLALGCKLARLSIAFDPEIGCAVGAPGNGKCQTSAVGEGAR